MQYLDIDTNKRISKIGLGTYQFGSAEWGYGDRYAGQEARAIVRRALELGVTLFDTAEIYGFEVPSVASPAPLGGGSRHRHRQEPLVSGAVNRSSGRPSARAGVGLRRHQVLPDRAGRPGGGAARRGQR